MAGLESPFIHPSVLFSHPITHAIESSILLSRFLSIGLGPLCIGRAPGSAVSD